MASLLLASRTGFSRDVRFLIWVSGGQAKISLRGYRFSKATDGHSPINSCPAGMEFQNSYSGGCQLKLQLRHLVPPRHGISN